MRLTLDKSGGLVSQSRFGSAWDLGRGDIGSGGSGRWPVAAPCPPAAFDWWNTAGFWCIRPGNVPGDGNASWKTWNKKDCTIFWVNTRMKVYCRYFRISRSFISAHPHHPQSLELLKKVRAGSLSRNQRARHSRFLRCANPRPVISDHLSKRSLAAPGAKYSALLPHYRAQPRLITLPYCDRQPKRDGQVLDYDALHLAAATSSRCKESTPSTCVTSPTRSQLAKYYLQPVTGIDTLHFFCLPAQTPFTSIHPNVYTCPRGTAQPVTACVAVFISKMHSFWCKGLTCRNLLGCCYARSRNISFVP